MIRANQSTIAAASFGLKKLGAIALIASAPARCAATAKDRASGKLLWPICAMNFTPCARAASPHATNNSLETLRGELEAIGFFKWIDEHATHNE